MRLMVCGVLWAVLVLVLLVLLPAEAAAVPPPLQAVSHGRASAARVLHSQAPPEEEEVILDDAEVDLPEGEEGSGQGGEGTQRAERQTKAAALRAKLSSLKAKRERIVDAISAVKGARAPPSAAEQSEPPADAAAGAASPPVEYCLGASTPWQPFRASASATQGERRRELRRLLSEGRGQGEEAGLRRGRKLLLASSKPLYTRCSAVSKQHKDPKASETALAACMRRTEPFCLENEGDVRRAARELEFNSVLKPRMNCLTVHSKGCSNFANNPETQPLRRSKAAPPPQATEIPRKFRTCALVGNGPGVRNVSNGAIIDRHDAVFRFNAMRFDRDAAFTGSKSTFRIFNKKRLMTLGRNDFRPADGEYWLFWNYMGLPLMHKVHSQLNARTYTFSPEVIRYMLNGYFAVRKDMKRIGMGGFGCPTNVNSGVHGIFLAFQMCEHVNLFGFSFNMNMLNERRDSVSPRMSRFHDWDFDTLMLRILHYSGNLNLCTH